MINNMNALQAIIFLLVFSSCLYSQTQTFEVYAVGFYNLENLFDTENDTTIWDEEFTPLGANNWTKDKYEIKLNNLVTVISDLGKTITPEGISVLGVSEIENKRVLEDLIKTGTLAENEWGIVHYDSPDFRGIDVGMIYRKDHFEVEYSESLEVIIYDGEQRKQTRDVLYVSGYLDGEKFHFLVNHWPSRRGGEKKSSPKREAAAAVNKIVIDSIFNNDPTAKVIVMGDLNDDPTNKSVEKILGAKPSIEKTDEGELYNPMYSLYKSGYGSNAYRDAWSLFDQIILSYGFLDRDQEGLFYHKIEIYKKPFMIQNDGHFKNYPFRTYAGGQFKGGYSDHFPVISYLVKKAE